MALENLTYLGELMGGVCRDMWIKCGFALLYVPYAFLFDSTQHTGLVALLVLVIFDMVTGLAASRQAGEKIESQKILRTALKLCFYYLFISSGHLAEKIIGFNLLIDEAILAVIGLTELISIMDNVGRMGYAIPQRLLEKLHNLRDNQ